MSRRDWIFVLLLLAAAFWFAWPNLRESNLGLFLTGRCDEWAGRYAGCVESPERRELH